MFQYQTIITPLGDMTVASDAVGVFSIHFGTADEHFFSSIKKMTGFSPDVAEMGGSFCAQMSAELEAYFNGELKVFKTPLNFYGTAFQKSVWHAIFAIPYGELTSYGALSRAIGNPKASRAVGGATGKNPIPIVVPCHRVVGTNGALTGFSAPGGINTKIKLLTLEGIPYEI